MYGEGGLQAALLDDAASAEPAACALSSVPFKPKEAASAEPKQKSRTYFKIGADDLRWCKMCNVFLPFPAFDGSEVICKEDDSATESLQRKLKKS